MTNLAKINTGEGFQYDGGPQRSPSWIAKRVGRVTASRLGDWLAVSKAKKELELPFAERTRLKARTDYEAELSYERTFNVPFSTWQSSAMEQGQVMESVVATKYARDAGVEVKPAGVFYNEWFAASPDGLVGDDGLVEIKWFWDTAFMDVLVNGVPENYMLQMQGQLWASGRKWVDFVVGNGNTNMYKVIRVERDEEIIARIKESLEGGFELPVIDTSNMHEVVPESERETLANPW